MSVSSATSFDARAVHDTLRQIQSLAAQVARLSRTDLPPGEFYPEFLNRVVTALGAVGGAVWTLDDRRQLALAYQVNFQETGLQEDSEDQRRHRRLLARVLDEDRPVLAPPHSGGQNGDGANPTAMLLMLGRFGTDLGPAGVVEIVQRPDVASGAQQSQQRFLVQMLEYAGDYLKNRQFRHISDRQAFWSRLEEFARRVHASLDPRQTAYTIANEARRLVDCDRVSVAICQGRRCAVQSVSGQDLLDRRSNTVRLLGRLAEAVVATGEPLWYTGQTTDMAPQLERAVEAFVDQTQSRAVGVLPLVPAVGEGEADEDSQPAAAVRRRKPVGAVIVERIEDNRIPPEMLHRVETVCRHSATALANALEHDSLFLMPLWRSLGRASWVVRARTLPKTLAVAAAAVALVAWLALWPAKLELEARGSLQPVLRRDVFAGIDGRVDEVHVEHRDRVEGPDPASGKPGTLLAVLTNSDLEEEIARITGERSTARQQMASIQRSLLEERPTVQEQNRLSGELAQVRQRLANLDAQWDLLQEKRKELAVHSPTGGEVVTWDVRNLLIRRPVVRGQRLMRIADTDGPWQLELELPEDRVGHVVRAWRKLHEKGGKAADEGIPVSFILATDPSAQYEGKVQEIQASAEVRGQEANTVLVKVQIDKTKLPHLMPGAGVIAKVDCGNCSVGYDLFHDVLAWFRRAAFRL